MKRPEDSLFNWEPIRPINTKTTMTARWFQRGLSHEAGLVAAMRLTGMHKEGMAQVNRSRAPRGKNLGPTGRCAQVHVPGKTLLAMRREQSGHILVAACADAGWSVFLAHIREQEQH